MFGDETDSKKPTEIFNGWKMKSPERCLCLLNHPKTCPRTPRGFPRIKILLGNPGGTDSDND